MVSKNPTLVGATIIYVVVFTILKWLSIHTIIIPLSGFTAQWVAVWYKIWTIKIKNRLKGTFANTLESGQEIGT